MALKKMQLFEEYKEVRAEFECDSKNPEHFKLAVEKANCLKFLVDILRFLELALFEVKKEYGVRRSDRAYTHWAEEQRIKLFEKNPVKVINLFPPLPILGMSKIKRVNGAHYFHVS